MTLNKLKYLLFFLIPFMFINCEEEVDSVKLPEFEKKLVITSFISPSDTVSFINVSYNKRLFGELGPYESTGQLTGTLSDGQSTINLTNINNKLTFTSNEMKINSGQEYLLRVSAEDGLSAEASCIVPYKRELSLQLDTFSVLRDEPQFNMSWKEFKVAVTFTDNPGEANYYRMAGAYFFYSSDKISGKINIWEEPLWIRDPFITDDESDSNNKITSTFNSRGEYTYYDSVFIKIYLLQTERSYYLYHNSLRNYTSGENPFAEVTPVFSNIKGGLGIFTSYTIDSLVYRLK